MNGKGDKRRPTDEIKYRLNYEKIFSISGKKYFCKLQKDIIKKESEGNKDGITK
jgi:hypothetical protein